ncbi:hypothetical protein BH24ACI3_BH24ACI3_04060 [soil metagenome]
MAQRQQDNQERSTSSSTTTQSSSGGSATQREQSSTDTSLDRNDQGSPGDKGGNGSTDKSLMGQVRSTAAGAYGTATSKAAEKLEEQKSTLTSSLTSVADTIRKFSESVGEKGSDGPIPESAAHYGDTAADKIEQVANYFEHHDIEAIYHDVEDLARQNPAIFVGGAFALGFLAARFLKSSSSRSVTASRGRIGTTGQTGTQLSKSQRSGTQSRSTQGSGSIL